MKKTILIILIFVFLLTLFIQNVSAALPPARANFNINIDKDFVEEGGWELNFIAIPVYKLGNLKESKDYFSKLKNEYTKIKEKCGLSSHFNYETIGNHGRLTAAKEGCEKYYSYVGPGLAGHTVNFNGFHYAYTIENKPTKDTVAGYPQDCKITNNTCVIFIYSNYKNVNPYFVVLEKLNSTKDVYFSEPVSINLQSVGKIKWEKLEPNTYTLKLEKLEIKEPHTLEIKFEDSEPVEYTPEPSKTIEKTIFLFIGLIIISILLLSFVIFKKMK